MRKAQKNKNFEPYLKPSNHPSGFIYPDGYFFTFFIFIIWVIKKKPVEATTGLFFSKINI